MSKHLVAVTAASAFFLVALVVGIIGFVRIASDSDTRPFHKSIASTVTPVDPFPQDITRQRDACLWSMVVSYPTWGDDSKPLIDYLEACRDLPASVKLEIRKASAAVVAALAKRGVGRPRST